MFALPSPEALLSTLLSLTLLSACAIEGSGHIETIEPKLLEALDLMAKAVSLDLSGGSDARVHATSSLDANASGGGTVTYRGEPKTIKKELSGGSQLESE